MKLGFQSFGTSAHNKSCSFWLVLPVPTLSLHERFALLGIDHFKLFSLLLSLCYFVCTVAGDCAYLKAWHMGIQVKVFPLLYRRCDIICFFESSGYSLYEELRRRDVFTRIP